MNKNNKENAIGACKMQYVSVEDPLNMHTNGTNETTLISESPNIINEENFIIAPGRGFYFGE